eukprot:966336-Pyramimonas_sp.AAC.1
MGDLAEGAGGLWMAIDGLWSRNGDTKRKKPVTPRMMRWIRQKLQPGRSREGAALWAAVATGYFFLLRAS